MTVGELIAALSHHDANKNTVVHVVEELFLTRGEWAAGLAAKLETRNPGPVESKRNQIVQGPSQPLRPMTEDDDKPAPLTTIEVHRVIAGVGADREPLREGALVCAKTGGPLMTVEDIRDQDNGIMSVVWFVDGKCYRDAFHRNSLNVFVQVP